MVPELEYSGSVWATWPNPVLRKNFKAPVVRYSYSPQTWEQRWEDQKHEGHSQPQRAETSLGYMRCCHTVTGKGWR